MVRIWVRVVVRIRVGFGMPIPEYEYGKNVRTATGTEGKNKYGLPVLYTQPNGIDSRLAALRLAEPGGVLGQIISNLLHTSV